MLRAPASEEHPRKAAIEFTNIGDLQLNAGDKADVTLTRRAARPIEL